jgi:hypothetical protein
MAAVGRALSALAVAAAASLVLLAPSPAAVVESPLCAGIPATWIDRLQLPPCGVVDRLPGAPRRVSSCRWVTPPARRGLEIAAGRISCPGAGRCVEHRAGAAGTWLGRPAVPVELRCADGRRVMIQLAAVAVADQAGRVCGPVRPITQELLGFRVPAFWGGRLVVIWALGTAAPNGSPVDLHVEGAILPLGGKQYDCLKLLSSGNPMP